MIELNKKKITGIARVIKIDDIDTDNIYHASLLTIHNPEKVKPHIFGNLSGFESFGNENHENEILLVGKNFGKGSTRQQAVTGFIAHKIKAIIGESFGPIYYNNAINSGLLLIKAQDISEFDVINGDDLEIDLINCIIKNKNQNSSIPCERIPNPVIDIIEEGGLLQLGKKMN